MPEDRWIAEILAANSLGEPFESGFERDAMICAEYWNPHFDSGPSAPFECISESPRVVVRNFRFGGQFTRRRTAVFDLDVADHRQMVCRRISEFAKQPLPAGRLGERELGTGVDRTHMVLVPRVLRQRQDRSVRPQTKESIESNVGNIHSARVTGHTVGSRTRELDRRKLILTQRPS